MPSASGCARKLPPGKSSRRVCIGRYQPVRQPKFHAKSRVTRYLRDTPGPRNGATQPRGPLRGTSMSTALPAIPASTPFFSRVDGVGQWLAPLGLRLLLAWEFFEAGREKLQGSNWFADLGERFPLPFSLISPDLN